MKSASADSAIRRRPARGKAPAPKRTMRANPDVAKPASSGAANGANKIFAFFRDKLLAGELKAGDRLLGERELAPLLNVSRPILRESLRSLAMLGILEIQHGRGAFIRRANASILGEALTLCLASEPNILDDVLQARIAIECQAIRLACVRASDQDLVSIAAAMDVLIASLHNPRQSGEADAGFHTCIVRASGSPVLIKMYEALGPLLRRSLVNRMEETYRLPPIVAQVAESHRDVLLSLMRRDADQAEQRLREHFAIGDEVRRNALISAYQRKPADAKAVSAGT